MLDAIFNTTASKKQHIILFTGGTHEEKVVRNLVCYCSTVYTGV